MAQAQQDSQQTLADRLAANTTGLRYQDLQNQQQLWQQGFQNQLATSQNNAQNILGASNALNGASALQAQFNGQLAGLGQVYQDYNQGNIDQQYNDWYQRHFGYDQQRLTNLGNALNSTAGQFQGSATSGLNPAYKPRTVGGAVASGVGGAAAGGAIGAAIAGGSAGSVAPGWGTAIGAVAGLASYYL